jgi:hypothetical protein
MPHKSNLSRTAIGMQRSEPAKSDSKAKTVAGSVKVQ